jgi:bacteriocin-like protein
MSKSSLRDQLTMTTCEAKIELTEQELSRVIGGGKTGEKPLEFLKITMKHVTVSSY